MAPLAVVCLSCYTRRRIIRYHCVVCSNECKNRGIRWLRSLDAHRLRGFMWKSSGRQSDSLCVELAPPRRGELRNTVEHAEYRMFVFN